MDARRIDALARRQHLVLTRRQSVEAGLSKRTWYRRIERGEWTELHPGVVALPGAPATPSQRIAAAVLAVGHGAMASHASAARAWAGEPEPNLIDVVVPGRDRQLNLDGVRVHRPRDLVDLSPSLRHGSPVTNPLRTLVDLGATEPPAAVTDFLSRSLIGGWFSMAAARAVQARHAGPGRSGAGVLRQVLADWSLGDRPPDSVVEVRVGQLLVKYQIIGAEFQRPLAVADQRFIPDFTFVPQRVIVEIIGWSTHGTRAAFERDPARTVLLAGAGWLVLEFTWLQVVRRPGWVAARIAEVLAARAAA